MTEVQQVYIENQVPTTTVRDLLWDFGAERRGKLVVGKIRKALKLAHLVTSPDFESAWIDARIQIQKADEPARPPAVVVSAVGSAAGSSSAVGISGSLYQPPDPAHQLSRLEASNLPPVTIGPDETIEKAVTVMLKDDYSQLPVMTGEYRTHGVITWKSIARQSHFGKPCDIVRACMEQLHPAQELRVDRSIFDAVNTIDKHDFVLVKDDKNKTVGIVTAHDVGAEFNKLTAPFLLLGEIENHVRNLISPKFDKVDLKGAKDQQDDGREVETVADLTFGEYARLLQSDENWKKLNLKLDRKVFIIELDKVRIIRNDVMHFDPDGISDTDLITLQKFARFLGEINVSASS